MPKNADPLPIDQRIAIYDWINEGAFGSNSLAVNPTPSKYKINLKTHPNPFNNFIRISFLSENTIQKEIRIYDMMGIMVRSINIESIFKGENYIFWDGKSDLGKIVRSGIYFVKLNQDFETLGTQKVLLLK